MRQRRASGSATKGGKRSAAASARQLTKASRLPFVDPVRARALDADGPSHHITASDDGILRAADWPGCASCLNLRLGWPLLDRSRCTAAPLLLRNLESLAAPAQLLHRSLTLSLACPLADPLSRPRFGALVGLRRQPPSPHSISALRLRANLTLADSIDAIRLSPFHTSFFPPSCSSPNLATVRLEQT
ncbi:hypothetical protein L1887_56472 [Cichorium endivia]|nr:hypothetical protein L1887_56472 [Cichorium endivia]